MFKQSNARLHLRASFGNESHARAALFKAKPRQVYSCDVQSDNTTEKCLAREACTCTSLGVPPPLGNRAFQRQQRGQRCAVAAALIAHLPDAVAAEAHL